MAVDKQQIKAMRWLYSDDKAYKRAVRELIVKDLKDSGDAEKLKKYYKTKAKLASRELKSQAKEIKKLVPKHALNKAVDYIVLRANAKNVSAVISVFVVLIVGINLVSGSAANEGVEQTPTQAVEVDDAQNDLAATTTAQPSYDSLLPNVATASAEQIRYDQDRQVTSFVDSIGDVNVTVSMQPLPDEFLGDPNSKVQSLAEGFAATEKIDAGEINAYRGVSVVDGVETVIFSKNKLLVFIQSRGPVEKEALSNYIEALQ